MEVEKRTRDLQAAVYSMTISVKGLQTSLRTVGATLASLSQKFEAIQAKLNKLGDSGDGSPQGKGSGASTGNGGPTHSSGTALEARMLPRMDLPPFDGTDPLAWLAQAEQYFLVHHTALGNRVKLALIAMSGRAMFWARWVLRPDASISWDQFSKELVERFGDSSAMNAYKAMHLTRQTGSLEDYLSLFEEGVSQLPPLPPEQYLGLFLGGLEPSIRDRLPDLEMQDIFAAIRAARRRAISSKPQTGPPRPSFSSGSFSRSTATDPVIKGEYNEHESEGATGEEEIITELQRLQLSKLSSNGLNGAQSLTLFSQVEERCLLTMVDSGASHCFISNHAARVLQLSVDQVAKLAVVLGDGTRVTSQCVYVTSNWLACFPASARKNVYDTFFLDVCATEVVQMMVPCFQPGESGSYDSTAVIANAERLLVICLQENDFACPMTREFDGGCQFEDVSHEQVKKAISASSQLITSIPVKTRRGAPVSLFPRLFFKKRTSQLLRGIEEWDLKLEDQSVVTYHNHVDGIILLIGETFACTSRRGSTDVLLREIIPKLFLEIIPKILGQVQTVLSSTSDLPFSETFESRPGFRFWLKNIEAVNDSHSVERIAEELLRQLATQKLNEDKGYWVLWMLFGRIFKRHPSMRFIFVEKFLLWKVFPTCCLRWIIHFFVLECPHGSASSKSYNARSLSATVHQLIVAWSGREFVQSSPTEQQIYVTAALGLCLQNRAKEDLDATKVALHLILQEISCRLESLVFHVSLLKLVVGQDATSSVLQEGLLIHLFFPTLHCSAIPYGVMELVWSRSWVWRGLAPEGSSWGDIAVMKGQFMDFSSLEDKAVSLTRAIDSVASKGIRVYNWKKKKKAVPQVPVVPAAAVHV